MMQREPSPFSLDNEHLQRGEFSISDLARTYTVSLRTLRFYEDRGLLHPRRQGTARFYSAADRIRLELIIKGKKLGFTLAEISELIAARPKHGVVEADSDDADVTVGLGASQIATQIAHLERQRSEIDDAIEELRRAHARLSPARGD